MLRSTRLAILGALVPGSLLAAQQPSAAPSSLLRVDATGLRSARYSYELAVTRDGIVQPLGSQTISFSDATYAGVPSWLILEARSGAGITGLDSLVATRDGLAPLHWGSSAGPARLAAEFTRDTLYGATSSPLGKRSLVGPAPRGVIASEGMLDGLMQLAPIGYGWTTDATLLVADLTGTRLIAARLVVEREEEVTVPAGTFPSWVVSVRTGNAEKWLWVSKDDRMVVKTSQALAQLNGAVVDRVLTRVDDLTLIPPPAVPLPKDARSANRPPGSR
ncbi:MAG: hypothetical protein ABR499_02305 [Gemmatimonadaceae bacterium]